MIPLRDNIPYRTFPLVNYAMIGICTLVFLSQLGRPELIEQYGMIPARVLDPQKPIMVPEFRSVMTRRGPGQVEFQRPALPAALPALLTPLSCIFLHGGWMHFLGNMWFLHIFGDNCEDRFGHAGYLVFYLVAGVAASLAHLASNPASTVPTIGASGAIAGVMGAYLLLYPRAMVLTLIPIVIFIEIVVLPAPIFLGIWFIIQFFQGAFAISAMKSTGVAWWAHIGGFVAGAAVVFVLNKTKHLRSRVDAVRPGTENVRLYQVYPRRSGGRLPGE